ncbi:MAG: nucleotidyltransferase domain-containing protein [Bacteroidales bacterium]|jgi:predicted nucleotidyltransferase|nr:nucleotidyltransferase domain-containing protein [Bacteroidaceae bacterium]MBR5014674.1 nucleotidyltransferase domain-containing protein [Bacteroidales bacterium]
MVYTIQEIRSKVLPILVKYRIPAMYLFGSYARGDATEDSDIDFLIDTTGTELTSLLRLGALYCDLEEAFQKPIDLITVRSIMQESSMESDIDFRNTVLKERVRLDDVA